MNHCRSSHFFMITSPNFQTNHFFFSKSQPKMVHIVFKFSLYFLFFLHAGSTPHRRKVDSTFHSLASWSSHSSKRSPTFPKNRLNISPKQTFSKISPLIFLKTLPKVSSSPSFLFYMSCWPSFLSFFFKKKSYLPIGLPIPLHSTYHFVILSKTL